MLLGICSGLAQWSFLRRYEKNAIWWIPSSTIGWAVSSIFLSFLDIPVGDLLMFLYIGFRDFSVRFLVFLFFVIAGAITGAAMLWILRDR